MATIINHPGWDEDPWEIELHEAPVIDRDDYLYSDESPDKIADETPMRNDFGWGLVEGIANLIETVASGVGAALSGVGNFVGGAFEAVFTGVSNFIEGIAKAIRSIFGGLDGNEAELPPAIFSPIKSNLEAALKPSFDEIKQANENIGEIRGDIEETNKKLDEGLQDQTESNQKIGEDVEKLKGWVGDPGEDFDKLPDGSIAHKLIELEGKTQEEYNSLNSRLWGEQGEINKINETLWNEQTGWNATQEKINEDFKLVQQLQGEVQEEQEKVQNLHTEMLKNQQQYIMRTIFIPGGSSGAYDDYFSVTKSGTQWRVSAKGSWVGRFAYQGAWWLGESWSPNYQFQEVPTTGIAEPRVHYFANSDHSAIIQYWVDQAVYKELVGPSRAYTSVVEKWTDAYPEPLVLTKDSDNYSIYFEFTWKGAAWTGEYSAVVLLNGKNISQWGPVKKLGPINPFESGRRTRSISLYGLNLKAGDELRFRTYSSAGLDGQTDLENVFYRVSWTEVPEDPLGS